MLKIWLWLFAGINLLVRLPIRIAKRVYWIESEKLDTADLISTLAAVLCFIGLCISALLSEEVDTALAVICILLFGGISLLIGGAWLYVKIKERKNK